jgi:hypothetical protein
VEISDGVIINYNYEFSVKLVNKSNIQLSKTASRVTHTRGDIKIVYSGFEVLTEVGMNGSVLWDVMPYSLLKVK